MSNICYTKAKFKLIKSPKSKSPRKSPRKIVKPVVVPLIIDNDSEEDHKDYEKVSMVIEEIPPFQRKIRIGAFKDVEFWINKAYEASSLNQPNAAIDFYKHGMRIEPLNPLLYYNIGALFSQKNE